MFKLFMIRYIHLNTSTCHHIYYLTHSCVLCTNKIHVRRTESDLEEDVNIACMTETKFVCDRVEQFLYDHVGNANQCSVDIISFDISFRYM